MGDQLLHGTYEGRQCMGLAMIDQYRYLDAPRYTRWIAYLGMAIMRDIVAQVLNGDLQLSAVYVDDSPRPMYINLDLDGIVMCVNVAPDSRTKYKVE